MEDIILCLDDIIRKTSEVMFLEKKDEFLKKEENLDIILNSIYEIKNKIKEYNDITLEILCEKTISMYSISCRKFQQSVCRLKEYILGSYEISIEFYREKNLDIISEKNSALYKQLINRNLFTTSNRKKYILEFNRIYDISMKIEIGDKNGKKDSINICSFGNPWQEALLYAEAVNSNTEVCVIFGFGLGYHIQEITARYPNLEIYVIESDIEQIRKAVSYRNLSDILKNEHVNILYCKEIEEYADNLNKIINLCERNKLECKMWMPSIKSIENQKLRELLERYKLSFFSMDYFKDTLENNFEKNISLKDSNVIDIKYDIEKKDVLLIAAGPSLDTEIVNLKKMLCSKWKKNICVICVGKVCRRILDCGIKPDYIIVTDANERTRWQISGIEEIGIPLIYISTAASNVVRDYKGKRYIAYQKGFEKSEQMAIKEGYPTFETGGSVATFAIDMSLRFKCKRLVCLGLDMGYIGEQTHSGNIGGKLSDKSRLMQVDAVGGKKIYTNKSLDMYRLWIEKRIVREKDIEIINASYGAKINGMKEKRISDIYDLI